MNFNNSIEKKYFPNFYNEQNANFAINQVLRSKKLWQA
ncbi:hypothetical protein LPE509_00270 [Legionella pneumophila subsp. pneumophila LPE509]|nr:hypothetical protein LPE509_00270 [Legionella pneumophila subsp. pneumophila LPE509]